MKILTVKDIAKLLRASPSTIYSWAEQGLIPCLKVNGLLRFSEDDVISWLKNSQKQPVEGYNILAGRRPRKGGQV
ncbi:MAG: helix-turn-helix domain-containing protein [Nitrospirota bacterium]|jgi:excisionase family DNA binding protein